MLVGNGGSSQISHKMKIYERATAGSFDKQMGYGAKVGVEHLTKSENPDNVCFRCLENITNYQVMQNQ